MHTDPRRGVVDEHCRLHGTRNLYVAGSSVFPTCGAANPTLTIVALALRMADRIKQELN
jgi:choline dehydrogenase-like flavoprotein